jgi:hypothetical protein
MNEAIETYRRMSASERLRELERMRDKAMRERYHTTRSVTVRVCNHYLYSLAARTL